MSSNLLSPASYQALSALAGFPPPPQIVPWVAVRQRFEQFNKNLSLTPLQTVDGYVKKNGVISCLNRHYYGSSSNADNAFLIGSWAKGTEVRPPRDIDLYFVVPYSVYSRFQDRRWNRQSAMLQEVKDVLTKTYPNTDMRGDGQVVVVRFETYNVEVVPAILLTDGRYWICNTNGGGSYKVADPSAEVRHINAVDQANNRNLRPLIRMLKSWQEHCTLPLKSFQLELLAADFLGQSPWNQNDFFWFDWISRDFFAYLYHRANSFIFVPGTGESIYLGSDWQSRAESAYYRAKKACEHEKYNQVEAAGDEWQKIFGSQIPRTL